MRSRGCRQILAFLCLGIVAAWGTSSSAADQSRCLDDAMLVLDASGSMAGTDMNSVSPHIAKVQAALAEVLPQVAPLRHLGLMIYGPGAGAKCHNIELRLPPGPNSAEVLMGEVNGVVPAGQTPLTDAVRQAAEALEFRKKPAVVVLLTDGEETCGGDPCRLARQLRAEAVQLTIHVVAFKVPGASWLAPGIGSSCMAEETGGLAISAHNRDELIEALKKTLTCPLFSDASRSRQVSGKY